MAIFWFGFLGHRNDGLLKTMTLKSRVLVVGVGLVCSIYRHGPGEGLDGLLASWAPVDIHAAGTFHREQDYLLYDDRIIIMA